MTRARVPRQEADLLVLFSFLYEYTYNTRTDLVLNYTSFVVIQYETITSFSY